MTNPIVKIDIPAIGKYEYHSAAYYIKQNGDRHKANGDKYLEQGMLKHAAGSFTKAARNYQRAYDLELNQIVSYGCFDQLNEQIARDLLDYP